MPPHQVAVCRRRSERSASISPTRIRRNGATPSAPVAPVAPSSAPPAADPSPSAASGRRPRRASAAGEHRPIEPTWRRLDLHLHTAASVDYQEPGVTALDILRRAEERGLDVIAFTDHNSVRGYADLWREIEDLELLEYLKRLQPAEEERLREYRRLLAKILLLPGFEFTATFGFHILAIFPERTSVRLMEHLLLLLGVPEERFGSGEVGATSDVLRVYEVLADHGALVIGAHVNSTHGVAMQGLRFGGQTKIAYTQDPHLHALEVTDLALGPHRRSTARFFSGAKPEYPRRMHCIQGSDAHRLDRDPQRESNLGIGDRATEALLPVASFAALKELFLGDDFERTRPYEPYVAPIDVVKAARAEGNTAVQSFHESASTKKTGVTHVLRDVVALANGDGGVVYVGVSPFEKRPVAGVADPAAAAAELAAGALDQIAPPLAIEIETLESDGKAVLALQVPPGLEKPYALGAGGIFVRHGGESTAATRDEIVAMVREVVRTPSLPTPPGNGAGSVATLGGVNGSHPSESSSRSTGIESAAVVAASPTFRRRSRRGGRGRTEEQVAPFPSPETRPEPESSPADGAPYDDEDLSEFTEDAGPDPVAPRSGIEVLYSFEQDGQTYYTLRDLRNEKLIHNVTRSTDRRIFRSAIVQREEQEVDLSQVRWSGDRGLWRSYKPRGGERRYHLIYRGDGEPRVFYGVSEEGMDDAWRATLPAR